MANNIERLNYYEREHLRSFDFIAEQNYHLEMRRRLNLALHLWGIVEGLDVRTGVLVPGAPAQFFITEGMAIDAYGREIVLFTPHPLTEDDLVSNRIGQPGRYSLWISYERRQTTPPSPGYGICDATGQYTRWRESAKIVIKEQTYANGPEPRVFDTLSDDPETESWLVRLGTIDAGLVGGQLTITDARPEQRTYIGLRAQRVVASVNSLTPPSADVALPIAVENDILEKKNLIVGNDFVIDTTKVKPPPDPVKFPDPTKFPGPAGNIKAENVFLTGSLYSTVGGEWLGLTEFLQRFVPDVITGIENINFPGNSPGGGVITDTLNFTVASNKIKKIGRAEAMAAIASFELNTRSELNSIVTNPDKIQFKILNVGATPSGVTDNACDVSVQWSVAPTLNDVAVFRSAVLVVTISYLVFCFPAS